jgi:hypothetical protein
MTLSRLLAAALVICSLPAFAQDQQVSKLPPSAAPASALSLEAVPTAGEPWRIIPNLSPDRDSGKNNTDRDQSAAEARSLHFEPAGHYGLLLRSDGSEADLTCYAIRSYVVARDSKDSDSTHPAGYSTCRPSDRYQVRTTEMRVVGQR